MKTIALALASTFTLVGCVTSGQGLPGRDGNSTKPTFDLEPDIADDAAPRFPERLSKAELPAADRISHRILAERGGAVSAQVKLCVAPTGAVAGVDLLESSGMPEYDRAVVDAIAGWQYAAYAAPAQTTVCGKLTVAYRAP